MENIQKHIVHWQKGANESLETSEILVLKGKYLFGLFFCHLAIEKQLKALFIKHNNDFPPKTHKLLYLANNIGIEIHDDMKLLFSELMEFQLEGRYPEFNIAAPTKKKATEIINKTKDALSWLQNQ